MTRREKTAELLAERKYSAKSLADLFEVEVSDILEDLKHIQKSIKPKKLIIDPAYCKTCNFIFKERSRLNKPSKCPKCNSEWIEEPMFSIK